MYKRQHIDSVNISDKQEKKVVASTPSSSRIIGKYEIMINPETKKKRIVISSKPVKFSYRTNPQRKVQKTSHFDLPPTTYSTDISAKKNSINQITYNENYTSITNNGVNNQNTIPIINTNVILTNPIQTMNKKTVSNIVNNVITTKGNNIMNNQNNDIITQKMINSIKSIPTNQRISYQRASVSSKSNQISTPIQPSVRALNSQSNISTPKVTRISLNSNNIQRYTPRKNIKSPIVTTQNITKKTNPLETYNLQENQKIVRVSSNNSTRNYQPSQMSSQSKGGTKVYTTTTTQNYKIGSPTYVSSSNQNIIRISRGLNSTIKQNNVNKYRQIQSNNTNIRKIKLNSNNVTSRNLNSNNITSRNVNSNILNSYNPSKKVQAFSSRSGAVNYKNGKSREIVMNKQARIIKRPSQNISKNSIRYEKLQTGSILNSKFIFYF